MADGNEQQTILLVDDEEFLRNLTEEVLSERGYRVLVAGDAAEALELARNYEGRIDLLMTDMRMPGMDGPELVIEFRKDFPDVRVVFITAHHPVEARSLAPDDPILAKPFCIDELCSVVSRQLIED